MRNPSCKDCDLHQYASNVCLTGKGDTSEGILIVGDAPTAIEDYSEEYLVGRPGQLLIEELRRAGFQKTPYYTGVCKCNSGGEKPDLAQLKACAHFLQSEIGEHKPKYILTLGATATKAVAKESKITTSVGKIIERDGITYMPCFSPAYVLRDPGKLREFQGTLRRFRELTQGEEKKEVKLRVRIVDRSNLEEFMEAFKQEPLFVYDLETSGLDHYSSDSYINCIGTYLPQDGAAWVIPVKKAPTLPPDALQKLIKWMESQHSKAVGQNIKFDSLWMRRKFGVTFYSHFDTMLAHYLLDENQPHGLKEMARYYLNAPDYDLTTSEKKGNVDPNKLFTYCAWDCYYTYELYRLFSKELMKEIELRNLMYQYLMPMSRLYEEIEVEGHHVNLQRMRDTEAELNQKMKSSLASLNRSLGREINWNSTKQVGEALYGDLGLKPSVFTDKGAPSTGEAALVSINHPISKTLQEYRGYQKFLSTYIEGWEEFMVNERLYLSTKLHGTVTGRFSSRLHQVPRDGSIRNLVEAPPGWTFIQADLSQAELRVIAIVSGDPELTRCYNEGIDVHWRTTINILRMGGSDSDLQMAMDTAKAHTGVSPSTVTDALDILEAMGPERAVELNKGWKEKRKQSKGVNFGYVYGMGANKFCEYAKIRYDWPIELHESQQIREAFFHTYYGLPPWHERMRNLVKIDGFVRSLSGRKRRLPGIWSPEREVKAEAERQAINSPIQGFIGDLKGMGMLSIRERISDKLVRIKGEVHDSVLLWVKTEALEEVLPRIKDCMEHPDLIEYFGIKLSVPIVSDIEVGTWGKGRVWHPESTI